MNKGHARSTEAGWPYLPTIVSAFLLLCICSNSSAAPLFAANYLSFDTGDGPSSVAIADFNRDGKADLAATNSGSNTVSVLLGQGEGTFGAKTDFGSGGSPRTVAIGDLNADGKADLAMANAASNTVSVPTEAQGSGVFPVTIRATDNGPGALRGSAAITITVNEVNVAPVLAPIGNKFGPVGEAVTFTATATDADIPAKTLTFSPDAGAPAGATIGASTGAFSWTPSANGTFPVTVRVTDNGTPALSAFEAISIGVGLNNQPPVVSNPGNKTVNELTPLAFTVTATDADIPANTITWSLTLGSPSATGATINPSTGAFSWTPTELQGPGVYPVSIVATDNGSPVMSSLAGITITVNEVNVAPVLAPIGNKTAVVGKAVTFTATATDADFPTNTLTFWLDAGAPAGATINGTTGTFSFTPTAGQVGANPVTVRVTDNGSPQLSNFRAITITVLAAPNQPPVLAAIPNVSLEAGTTADAPVSATDLDGDAITFTVLGPNFAALTSDPQTGNTRTGNIHIAPPLGTYGSLQVLVTANTARATASKLFTIVVTGPDRAPAIAAPSAAAGVENVRLTIPISASDPDGDPITSLTADLSELPASRACPTSAPCIAAFFTVRLGNASGILTWTPSSGDARPAPYHVTFTASNFYSGSAITAITVTSVGTGPNLVGNPSFESETSGWGPADAAAIQRVAGGFDGGFSLEVRGTGATGAKFGVNDTPNWIVGTLSAGTTYRFAAWVRSAAATGQAQLRVREYAGTVLRGSTISDPGAVLSPAWQMVTVDYVAQATGSTLDFQVLDALAGIGETFQVDNILIHTAAGGGAGAAPGINPAFTAQVSFAFVVAPNPFNPEATLAFTTNDDGPIRLRIFDAAGRFVRTLLDERSATAGRRAVQFDGRGSAGEILPSGVYFYRLEAREGTASGRLVLMR